MMKRKPASTIDFRNIGLPPPITRLTLTVDTDTAAFDNHPIVEVVRILREMIARIESGDGVGKWETVRDSNGKAVGSFKLSTPI